MVYGKVHLIYNRCSGGNVIVLFSYNGVNAGNVEY